jgi:hypothetical protein
METVSGSQVVKLPRSRGVLIMYTLFYAIFLEVPCNSKLWVPPLEATQPNRIGTTTTKY